MKKLIEILFCIVYLLSYPEIIIGAPEIGSFYKLRTSTMLQECNIEGNSEGFIKKSIPSQSKFTIIGKGAKGIVIRFWFWGTPEDRNEVRTNRTTSASKQSYTYNAAFPSADDNIRKIESFNLIFDNQNWDFRYFLISESDLEMYSVAVKSRYGPCAGVATLPFKYRPTSGDFTKDITLTGLGGFKYTNRVGVDFNTMLGIGISSVTIDSSNTNAKYKSSGEFSAITLSFGEVIEWKKLQFGVFIGIDMVRRADVHSWINQGKPWLGFGIGFSVFSESSVVNEKTNK